jgi:peroxiredoxin Q/BCP
MTRTDPNVAPTRSISNLTIRVTTAAALATLWWFGADPVNAQTTQPTTQPAAIVAGQPAPAFTLSDQNDKAVSLSDYRGRWVVLYFYPKDDTPGCTTEACEFTEGIEAFQGLKAAVLGVSADTPQSHREFIEKHKLKLTLLCDTKRQVMTAYGAWQPTEPGSTTGKMVRSTVLIGPDGNVAFHWPTVSPKGHAEAVKQKIEELSRK